jgi:DamX protein
LLVKPIDFEKVIFMNKPTSSRSNVYAEEFQQSSLFDSQHSADEYFLEETGTDDVPKNQLLEDYRQRYGLSEDPFAQDNAFPLFTGAQRRELLDQVLHLVQFSSSVLVILGNAGVGKTRFAHAFMDSLSENDSIFFLSLNHGDTLERILLVILREFDEAAVDDYDESAPVEGLLDLLETLINEPFDENSDELLEEEDPLAVAVVDNAHFLDDNSIAMLGEFFARFPDQKRLHLVLIGEPELLPRIESLCPDNLLLNDFYLPSLSLAESVDYLNFRMEMADYLGPDIFTESMVEPWCRAAQGQLSMLHEYAQEKLFETVTPTISPVRPPLPLMHILAITGLVTVIVMAVLYMDDDVAKKTDTIVAAEEFNSVNLTSTSTPVEPLLNPISEPSPQTIIDNQSQLQPESEIKPEPVILEDDIAEEKIIEEKMVEIKQKPVETKITEIKKPDSKKVGEKTNASTSLDEKEILSWNANKHTIQLLGVSSLQAAKDYVAEQPNKKDLLIFSTKRLRKEWYVVITGQYASAEAAREAVSDLPKQQRDAGAWPRDVKTIQREIKN